MDIKTSDKLIKAGWEGGPASKFLQIPMENLSRFNFVVAQSTEYIEGYVAALIYANNSSNPYLPADPKWAYWKSGFDAKKEEINFNVSKYKKRAT